MLLTHMLEIQRQKARGDASANSNIRWCDLEIGVASFVSGHFIPDSVPLLPANM